MPRVHARLLGWTDELMHGLTKATLSRFEADLPSEAPDLGHVPPRFS